MRPTLNRIRFVLWVSALLLLNACDFAISPSFPIPDCEPYYTSLRGKVVDTFTGEGVGNAEVTLQNITEHFDCFDGDPIPDLHLIADGAGVFRSEPMLIGVENQIAFTVFASGCQLEQGETGVQSFVYDNGWNILIDCGNPRLTQEALSTAEATEGNGQ